MIRLKAESSVLSKIDPWVLKFKEFQESVNDSSSLTEQERNSGASKFQEHLSHFLFSPLGAKYRSLFKFEGELACGRPAPHVIVSAVDFQFAGFLSAKEWVPGMERLQNIVDEANITSHDGSPAIYNVSPFYANWLADKVIEQELFQNLGCAIAAIFITVLLFLASLRGALLVIFCVVSTITEVAGFMHLWGLTMNVLTCMTLVISVGLCVDFSAHIVHFFLAASGSLDEKVETTMTRVGPAVFNGGLSTLLAFILLSTSRSYVFLSFFKVFTLLLDIFADLSCSDLLPYLCAWSVPRLACLASFAGLVWTTLSPTSYSN